jgi:signal transduction histidine kinase
MEGMELDFVESGIKFKIKTPFSSVKIKVDKHRLEQVLDNLVQNAGRYTPEGGIIRVEAQIKDNYLMISVSDSGCGIHTQDLPHIFKKFYHGEKSRSRQYGGTGLGLCICKYIVEAHDREIWAESEVNTGSTFYFTIPIINKYGRDN